MTVAARNTSPVPIPAAPQVVAARFDPEELALIEAERSRLEAGAVGLKITRAEVVRSCVLRTLGRKGR